VITTGYEPCLSKTNRRRGYQRLLPRRLGSLLNMLPPSAISLDAAAEMLLNGGFYTRYNAARLLSERGDRDARLVMQEVLNTGNTPARASAARHLFRFSWFAAEPLLRQALNDVDERVREAAVYALCECRELAAYQLLVHVLPHESDQVREAAIWGLRTSHDSAAVPVLEQALGAQNPEVRIKALEILSANGSPEALPVVRRALADTNGDVVYNAVLSLVELQESKSVLEISQLIEENSGPCLESILRGFFHATNYLHLLLNEHPAVDVLLDALAHAMIDPTVETRQAVVWILAWLRHDHADALLRYMFTHETDTGVKIHILRVAHALMNRIAAELLDEARYSEDESLAEAAGTLLQNEPTTYDPNVLAKSPLNREELANIAIT